MKNKQATDKGGNNYLSAFLIRVDFAVKYTKPNKKRSLPTDVLTDWAYAGSTKNKG